MYMSIAKTWNIKLVFFFLKIIHQKENQNVNYLFCFKDAIELNEFSKCKFYFILKNFSRSTGGALTK